MRVGVYQARQHDVSASIDDLVSRRGAITRSDVHDSSAADENESGSERTTRNREDLPTDNRNLARRPLLASNHPQTARK
jgi:hypothetical protein